MMRLLLSVISFYQRTIAIRISMWVVLYTFYTALVVWLDSHYITQHLNVPGEMHTVLGASLGLFLVFRTNTAYDRWWEARKLWGSLVNEIRDFTIKVEHMVKVPAAERNYIPDLLIAFAWALKEHLRFGVRLQDVYPPAVTPQNAQIQHVPAYLTHLVYQQLAAWQNASKIDRFDYMMLDLHANQLMQICGACERIRKTQLSRSYLWFIRQAIVFYLLSLPWGLISEFHWWTVLACALAGYFMIGTEVIAEEVEEPFGTSDDDIRTDDITRTIERSTREIVAFCASDEMLAAKALAVADKSAPEKMPMLASIAKVAKNGDLPDRKHADSPSDSGVGNP
ncbi:protein of unknown function UPF0187 [Pirellula staleyi DSM 6068]|uniref:Bestrophin, RFP-TM, chloride channel n=1 Tax=Pirellula staleyi (strain ATCC 27377 / DSM 6068 / ICPB 4128) TaxID=530564 RepID=D2QZS8_PIRSD|nr:bestrophin family protein [Pirellula staleyi]ADB16561.1 protein of unknown function UPF0187 [Pirellula staleyi DSM 6068]